MENKQSANIAATHSYQSLLTNHYLRITTHESLLTNHYSSLITHNQILMLYSTLLILKKLMKGKEYETGFSCCIRQDAS